MKGYIKNGNQGHGPISHKPKKLKMVTWSCNVCLSRFLSTLTLNLEIIFIITFLISIHFLYTNYKFHPFQSLYFNSFLSSNKVSGFQVDSPNLSRSDALKFIIKTEKNKTKKIYVGNASWSPMSNGKDMLSDVDQKRLVFVGQELTKADYIYTNYVYKSDEKYNKKYKVPLDFDKIKDYKINNVLIYTVFKKKKLI